VVDRPVNATEVAVATCSETRVEPFIRRTRAPVGAAPEVAATLTVSVVGLDMVIVRVQVVLPVRQSNVWLVIEVYPASVAETV